MIKILIVDDEPFICDTLSHTFQYVGYKTLMATNGIDAIRIFSEEKPDAVFLDILLPDIDGIEVLRKIKKINPEVVVIMVSAVTNEETKEKCFSLGALEFVSKPFSMEYLRDIIATNVHLIRKQNVQMNKPKIMIVEDEAETAQALAHFIKKRIEVDIDTVFEGDSALKLLNTNDYDIVFLDISIPGPDGIEILKQMKHNKKSCAFIVISAWDGEEKAIEAIEAGAIEYMKKPLVLEILLARIKFVLKSQNKWISKLD